MTSPVSTSPLRPSSARCTVSLTVSAGPPLVAVPDLSGLKKDEAEQALAALGLGMDFRKVAGNRVALQNPPAATQVPVGSTVTVVS